MIEVPAPIPDIDPDYIDPELLPLPPDQQDEPTPKNDEVPE